MTRTKALMFAALLSGCAPAMAAPLSSDQTSPRAPDAALPFRIAAEVNEARTDPLGYARKARALRDLFRGDQIERPGEIAIATREGTAAVDEAIAYGSDRAEDLVLQLIIDDGVPDRGHRRILFSPDYTLIGVACASHRVWRQVCVLDFARAAVNP